MKEEEKVLTGHLIFTTMMCACRVLFSGKSNAVCLVLYTAPKRAGINDCNFQDNILLWYKVTLKNKQNKNNNQQPATAVVQKASK